eukprot:764499-Hanusia_phi.AAC.1
MAQESEELPQGLNDWSCQSSASLYHSALGSLSQSRRTAVSMSSSQPQLDFQKERQEVSDGEEFFSASDNEEDEYTPSAPFAFNTKDHLNDTNQSKLDHSQEVCNAEDDDSVFSQPPHTEAATWCGMPAIAPDKYGDDRSSLILPVQADELLHASVSEFVTSSICKNTYLGNNITNCSPSSYDSSLSGAVSAIQQQENKIPDGESGDSLNCNNENRECAAVQGEDLSNNDVLSHPAENEVLQPTNKALGTGKLSKNQKKRARNKAKNRSNREMASDPTIEIQSQCEGETLRRRIEEAERQEERGAQGDEAAREADA